MKATNEFIESVSHFPLIFPVRCLGGTSNWLGYALVILKTGNKSNAMHSITFWLRAVAIVALCAFAHHGSAHAQEIKIGSIIHLKNGFSNGGRDHFLDTQGSVKDHKALEQSSSNLLVFTNSSKDREQGSGSWKIISATGKADGDSLAYGDEIHLENMFPGAGLLVDENWNYAPVYGELFKRRGRAMDDYPVFTSVVSPALSAPWVVGGENVKIGDAVKAICCAPVSSQTS
jgi:hypothetical protein